MKSPFIMNERSTIFSLLLLFTCLLAHPVTSWSADRAFAAENLDQQVKAATLVQVGDPAPDFTCKTTDGKAITLSALKGKVVVLYFFSTTSLPAGVAEMRYLEQEVFKKLRERDDFQLIALGRGHTREELMQIGGANKLTFPLAADTQQEIFERYFTKFVPRMVVVRRDGTILSLANGSHEFEGILKLQLTLARELNVQAR